MATEPLTRVPPRVPRRRLLRMLSLGSVPPEWGGTTRGGVATFHATLLAELVARRPAYGVDVVGLVPFNGGSADAVAPVPVHLPAPGADEQAFYVNLLEQTAPDVVVFHHVAQRFAVLHARAATGVPAVGVVHSWSALKFRAGEERERVRRTIAEALDGISALVLPSAHARGEGERLGIAYPAPTEVIHYPLHAAYAEDVDVEREREGVVFVGSLVDPVKNPSAVLLAASRSDFSVTLAGEGEDEGRLRRRAAELRISRRVHFLGAIPTPAVREALLHAELLCLPSHSDAFGVAYLEALACGTPIVGFGPTVLELERVLGIDVGEPIVDGHAAEVGAAIAAVRTRTWPRRLLRERALAAFSREVVARRYVELFHRVVDARRRA